MALNGNDANPSKILPLDVNSSLRILAPLSRRGHGPGLLILADVELDLGKHEKTLDPPPLYKWAEEGFAVAQLRVAKGEGSSIHERLRLALSELSKLSSCDQTERIGVVAYLAHLESVVLQSIEACSEICAVLTYGESSTLFTSTKLPLLAHLVGSSDTHVNIGNEDRNLRCHYYNNVESYFGIPAHKDYHAPSASVAHTRSLTFLKPLVGGPYFNLEKIWDEHTYLEFKERSVEKTMATMVEEPYVNHVPTLTGGVGRRALTDFYRYRFIFNNPPDTELEVVSRTVGIDRIVDEFLFKATHDRVIDWLIPGIPATGRSLSVPFTSVVNIRGDRLYHEHISWDQATVLKQLGLLPDYLPFPYPITTDGSNTRFEYRLPVAGHESACKLADASSVESNAMLEYGCRKIN
ncbi:hypothetical protein M426DRAFT_264062 [Hypoxylon sp. CI-4A]|nr:hypothetical protein M426DRAFT_264062 [Hypoxylon sp. CI-4A]